MGLSGEPFDNLALWCRIGDGPGGEEAERSGQDSEGMAVPAPLPPPSLVSAVRCLQFTICLSRCCLSLCVHCSRVHTDDSVTRVLGPTCAMASAGGQAVQSTRSVTDKDRGQACESGVVEEAQPGPHPRSPLHPRGAVMPHPQHRGMSPAWLPSLCLNLHSTLRVQLSCLNSAPVPLSAWPWRDLRF